MICRRGLRPYTPCSTPTLGCPPLTSTKPKAGVGFMLMPALNRRRIVDIAKIIVVVALGVAWIVDQIFNPTQKK